MKIGITKNPAPKPKPDPKALGFGKFYTDHMLVMDYFDGAWGEPAIIPYGYISLDPSCMVFHYGQELFEGLKAYPAPDGSVLLFRPDKNAARFNSSAARMSIPTIPEETFVACVRALVDVDRDWVPTAPETSLYIRPFCFATEPSVSVHPSKSYKFMVILSPVGPYYSTGLTPVSILIEDELVRAVKGGTGFTKCGGNYAPALLAQTKAESLGCAQVLWLDGATRTKVEEVGTMNCMFKIAGTVYTSPLDGTILPGVTRDSILTILKDWNIPCEERALTVDELLAADKAGTLEEVFGVGTAAVISPIGELVYKGRRMAVGGGKTKTGPLSQKIYDELTGVQWGKRPDKFGWTVKV